MFYSLDFIPQFLHSQHLIFCGLDSHHTFIVRIDLCILRCVCVYIYILSQLFEAENDQINWSLIVVFCDKKENVQTKKSKVLVVSGPTAAGKSRLAFKLATLLNGELINVDSVKVLNLMKKEQYRMNLSLISKYDTL